MPFPVAAAVAAGAAIAGQGIQSAGAAARNRKQYHIQKKLMDYSQEKNKAMAMFNNAQQLQMWKDTGPVGQMEQLRKAGLNPGLVYGTGGAGGQTANAMAGQGQGTPSADVENIAGGMGITGAVIGEQLALLKAQKENIEADTAQKQAGATKTSGVDTELAKANTELTQIETKFQDASLEQRVANIANEGTKIANEMRSAMAQANIDQATQETTIKQYTQNLAGTILENMLKHSANEETKARIHKIGQDIAQNWKGLELKEKELQINQQLANLKAEFPDLDNVFARDIRAGLDKLWNIVNPGKKREELSTNYKK